MPKNYTKKNPRILTKDIYDYIAKNSSLTKAQARECFNTFAQLVEELALSKYIFEDTTINFPRIGHLYFKKIVGRKKGTTYYFPATNKEKGKIKKIVLTEDEPTTYLLSLKVSPTLHKKIKYGKRENDEK